MNQNRIIEEFKGAFGHLPTKRTNRNGREIILFAERIAKISRDEALEEAAIKSWSVGMDEHNRHQGLPHDCREVGAVAAKEIRALKEKS